MGFDLIAALSLVLAATDAPPRPRADLDVREVRSTRAGDCVLRALVGYSEVYPFLVVERIRLPLTEGEEPALEGSWALRDMKGAPAVPFQEGDDIADVTWSGTDLSFSIRRSGMKVRCTVKAMAAPSPEILCRTP